MKLDMINATKTDSVTENLVTQTEKTGLNTHQRNTAKNTLFSSVQTILLRNFV